MTSGDRGDLSLCPVLQCKTTHLCSTHVHTSELHVTTQREEATFQGTGVACVLRSATSKASDARVSVKPPPRKGHTWM